MTPAGGSKIETEEAMIHSPGILQDSQGVDEEIADYPEGGRDAWLVVVGAWCAMIPSMGILNTVGVLQAWMSEHQLVGYTESSIGWIVSAYAFFLYIGAAQIGMSAI